MKKTFKWLLSIISIIALLVAVYFIYQIKVNEYILKIPTYNIEILPEEAKTIYKQVKDLYGVEIKVVNANYKDDIVDVSAIEKIDKEDINLFYKETKKVIETMPSDIFKQFNRSFVVYYVSEIQVPGSSGNGIAVGYTIQSKQIKTVNMFISNNHQENSIVNNTLPMTLNHEMFHVITAVHNLDKAGIEALNPAGFVYGDNNQEYYRKYMNYFVTPYSLFSSTEDACEIFASKMVKGYYGLGSQAIQNKWKIIEKGLENGLEDKKFIEEIKKN